MLSSRGQEQEDSARLLRAPQLSTLVTSGCSLLWLWWKVHTSPGPAVGRNSPRSPFSHRKVLSHGPVLALELPQTGSSFPKDLKNTDLSNPLGGRCPVSTSQ